MTPTASHTDDHAAVRRPVAVMGVGLALTVLAGLAALADAFTVDVLSDHVHDVYTGYIKPDEIDSTASGLRTYLVTLHAVGALTWLWLIRALRRDRRYVPAAATTIAVVGWGIAVTNLVVTEYGEPILPPSMSIIGLLPCLAGTVAVVRLWRLRRGGAGTGA